MDLWPHSQWRADCQGRIKASSKVADGLMAALPNGGLTARAESEHRQNCTHGFTAALPNGGLTTRGVLRLLQPHGCGRGFRSTIPEFYLQLAERFLEQGSVQVLGKGMSWIFRTKDFLKVHMAALYLILDP